jgi:transcriptional regulator with XRE-family HTH domain
MNLKAFLAVQGITQKEFSEMLEVNERYMSRIINGHLMPGKRLKRDIETLTEGRITLEMKEKKTKR